MRERPMIVGFRPLPVRHHAAESQVALVLCLHIKLERHRRKYRVIHMVRRRHEITLVDDPSRIGRRVLRPFRRLQQRLKAAGQRRAQVRVIRDVGKRECPVPSAHFRVGDLVRASRPPEVLVRQHGREARGDSPPDCLGRFPGGPRIEFVRSRHAPGKRGGQQRTEDDRFLHDGGDGKRHDKSRTARGPPGRHASCATTVPRKRCRPLYRSSTAGRRCLT